MRDVTIKHVEADVINGWPAYIVMWLAKGDSDSIKARIFEYTEDVDQDLVRERARGFKQGLEELL